ncbi:MAG: pyridoxal-phosphate dependent enzyme [Chloroflexi bacterium]|nr:pyridoxal-phosphate dependent enzyme [Chloroflexota bacterium]
MIPSDWLDQAARRLKGQIQQTPLTFDSDLNAYIKWENRQLTGSFKIRGALNKVLTLQDWELRRGLVTASAGNHGQGVAEAGRRVGAPVTVFASSHAVPAKLDAMRSMGAVVRLVEGGYEDAERAAQSYAIQHDRTWISPYNDGQVIAGQATIALEILDQLNSLNGGAAPSAFIVPVGGGGLISGIGAVINSPAFDQVNPRPRLIGVQSEASPFFHALYHHGSQAGVVEQESLADGLVGAVEENSITIPLVRRFVDDFILVSEKQIASAVVYAWRRHGEKIEGSAAAALAALMFSDTVAPRSFEHPAVAVMSGGNIQPEVLEKLLQD